MDESLRHMATCCDANRALYIAFRVESADDIFARMDSLWLNGDTVIGILIYRLPVSGAMRFFSESFETDLFPVEFRLFLGGVLRVKVSYRRLPIAISRCSERPGRSLDGVCVRNIRHKWTRRRR